MPASKNIEVSEGAASIPPIVEVDIGAAKGNGDNINTTGRWNPAYLEGDDLDAISSGYT